MVEGIDDPNPGMRVRHRRPAWGGRSAEHAKVMQRTAMLRLQSIVGPRIAAEYSRSLSAGTQAIRSRLA